MYLSLPKYLCFLYQFYFLFVYFSRYPTSIGFHHHTHTNSLYTSSVYYSLPISKWPQQLCNQCPPSPLIGKSCLPPLSPKTLPATAEVDTEAASSKVERHVVA